MLNETNGKITLAIETAVLGGSLSLVRDGMEIDHWIGGDGVSRSEDLLLSISKILDKNSIDKKQIGNIAVSTGPGSYTGIRVGMATALGLKNSLNVPCTGVQVLDAMLFPASEIAPYSISAIPIGRDEICWQGIGSQGEQRLTIAKEGVFFEFLASGRCAQAVIHEKIFDRIGEIACVDLPVLKNAGSVLAMYIGLAAQDREDGAGMVPTYARDFV